MEIMTETAIIMPSLLSAPLALMAPALQELEECGVRLFHFDVMDGHYVPRITFGSMLLKQLQPHLKSQFDVHLMVDRPEEKIPWFDLESVRSITIHQNASKDIERDFESIRSRNKRVGISLNPPAPIDDLDPYLESVDQVLVMTVDPGAAGQSLIESAPKKVEHYARRRDELGLSYKIQVDGGINTETIRWAHEAGADEIVAGSAVFSHESPAAAYRELNRLIGNPL